VDSVLDGIAGLVARAAESWLGIFVLTLPIWLVAAFWLRRSLGRRRGFQAFAAAHRLQFAGTIASDARLPYTRIPRVAWAVLLSNTIEGEWDGLPIRLFDMPNRRNSPPWTTILVKVDGRLLRGPHTEQAIGAGPAAHIETDDLDVLCVSPKRLLDPSNLKAWLSFATTIAKAMERDAKEAARFDSSPDEPQAPRAMFGLFNE
jgi:hypothetical protein